jgi:hypothetical protein
LAINVDGGQKLWSSQTAKSLNCAMQKTKIRY